MSAKNNVKRNTPTSPIVERKESAEDVTTKSPEPDRMGMMLDTMNFLRTEFLGMKDRLVALESKTDKDSNPSGYATPESDQLGSMLRAGLDTHIPGSPKKGNNRGNKKPDDSDSKPTPVTKKVQQQNNHRRSLAELQREARVVIEPVVTATTAKDERQVLIKQLPSFKGQLHSLEKWPEFYLEVTKFQMTNETIIYAGAYVTNDLIEELIEKNQLAKDGGRTFMSDIAKAVDVYNCNLEKLEDLVKISIGPKTLVEYEADLKKHVSTIFKLSMNKGVPRIYRFEEFSRAIASYVKHFNQRLALLSGTDKILPMFATKQKDGYDGSVQIFLSALPQNYCNYLRQYMPEVKQEEDDIFQFVERFRQTHIKQGYNTYNDSKPLAEALLKDYPEDRSTFVPKTVLSNSHRSPARSFPKQLHSLPEQQEISDSDIRDFQQLAPEDPDSQDQTLIDEEEDLEKFDDQLHALTSPPQKTLYDPGIVKKASTSRGCFNTVIFGSCTYEKQGLCKNLHDKDSLRKTAELMYSSSAKFLGKQP